MSKEKIIKNFKKKRNMRGSNIWYLYDDLKYEDYPLTDEEENKLFQEFKILKANGKTEPRAEYHEWKEKNGLPVKHHGPFNDMNGWIKDPIDYIVDENITYIELYEKTYGKEAADKKRKELTK